MKRLEAGKCDSLSGEGFTCVEHYQCIGDGVTLATTGSSTTRIVSIITDVMVEQTISSINTFKYGFSILDATDNTCETYTKVSLAQRGQRRFQTGVCLYFSRFAVDPELKENSAAKLTVRS